MVTLYGISNCDTVKKARLFLDGRKINYCFHDFRKDGLDPKQVKVWLRKLGTDTLVNKRSRTWKELTPAQQASIDSDRAAELIADNPTLIKRPLLEIGETKSTAKRYVGFDKKQYSALFS